MHLVYNKYLILSLLLLNKLDCRLYVMVAELFRPTGKKFLPPRQLGNDSR